MRVIAGQFKGRHLKAVPGKTTRPTADKIKEAIFQVIGPFFNGGHCLDLFAGSGSLGIEALSRGMEHSVFVDKHPKAVQTIQQNTEVLHISDKIEIFRTDAYRAINAVSKRDIKFNLILLDPPYGKVDYEKLLNQIIKLEILEENGVIYCEYDSTENLPSSIKGLTLIKEEIYGKTIGISIYRKEKHDD
ncbi:16S rRNA (guanine(966)-N(2))-methyltransferase RsmD [Virgibacillus sp. MSJ-26]|uniref:16S rRNA (guanine(966)-N(2))-methyltransferase RsmD n=1 Tax=Virgibacillus sp. MSJ-26 TaxID=2841522 RepID=UPI001C11EF24|nr:16S rRNA (guanine(966)-N(2))-methyltransferase RsmD [Virgibacillus sp. MSJ-26]MBU5467756.1 16S rRNA (guanine(966)-N(2))-methyltransferase RsmD [Virgibacillus sp. MSJ-26]